MRLFIFDRVVAWLLLLCCSLSVPCIVFHLPRFLRCAHSVNSHMSGRPQLCSILYGVCLAAQGEPNVACAVSCTRSARHGGCAVEGQSLLVVFFDSALDHRSSRGRYYAWGVEESVFGRCPAPGSVLLCCILCVPCDCLHFPRILRCAHYVNSHMNAPFW